MTPFDVALALARDALLGRLTAAEAELEASGQLSVDSYDALQDDLDTWFKLSRDRRRWLTERAG